MINFDTSNMSLAACAGLTAATGILWGGLGTEEYKRMFAGNPAMPVTNPHQAILKYFSRPVYKLLVPRINPSVAVGATFFLTDLLAHQILSNAFNYAKRQGLGLPFTPTYNVGVGLGFFILGIPVMYAKYMEGPRAAHQH